MAVRLRLRRPQSDLLAVVSILEELRCHFIIHMKDVGLVVLASVHDDFIPDQHDQQGRVVAGALPSESVLDHRLVLPHEMPSGKPCRVS